MINEFDDYDIQSTPNALQFFDYIVDHIQLSKMDRGTGVLSDMLSSRSYLDLSQEQPHMRRPRLNPLEEVNPEAHEPDRRVKSRDKRIPSKAPGTSEQVPESKSSVTPDRPARKRGRPKLETVKDAAAIEVDPARSTCGCHRVANKLHRNDASKFGVHNARTDLRKKPRSRPLDLALIRWSKR